MRSPDPAAARRRASLIIGAALTLAACERTESPPPPVETPSEAPRSIFENEAVQPAPTPRALPPLETRIAFPDGSDELSEAARAELATVARSPQVAGGGAIVLSGHSDAGGSDQANLRASRTRANAVRDFLIDAGIAAERITVIAFGEQNPIRPNALPNGEADEAGRAANRRVDIRVETGTPPAPTPRDTDAERERTLIEELSEDREEGARPGGQEPPAPQ